jgi:hypothetical protein
VSSTRAPASGVRLIGALILGAALGVGGALIVERGRSNAAARRVTRLTTAPKGSLVAFVMEEPCAPRLCRSLHVGKSESDATQVERLENHVVDEIAWTPDGTRVGFVVDGRELWIYDAAAPKLAGRVGLMTVDAGQSRFARGITFSENGRAVTFDDCPRQHSGCRAGVVGIPQ